MACGHRVKVDWGVRASWGEGHCVLWEDTEGGPGWAEVTCGEKWAGSVWKVDAQAFLMDCVGRVSERGGTDDHRFLAKQSNKNIN